MAQEATRSIIVCKWHECPFIADVTTRFADAHGLSAREREVLVLVVDGLRPSQISEELVISQGTVKAHLHRIYHKAGVTGRAGLMAKVREFSAA